MHNIRHYARNKTAGSEFTMFHGARELPIPVLLTMVLERFQGVVLQGMGGITAWGALRLKKEAGVCVCYGAFLVLVCNLS